MGHVLQESDFASARQVADAKLTELGFAPVCLAPGERNEGHSHTIVEEVLVVQSGEGQIQIEDETFDVCAGSVALVPAGQFHALCNTGKQNLEGVVLFNANFDKRKVKLKNREEHFGVPSSETLNAQVAELKAANKKLAKRLKKQKAKRATKRK